MWCEALIDDELYSRFGDERLRINEGTQRGDPDISLMFALSIHHIVQRIEADCDLVVHRWNAETRMPVRMIDQVKLALDFIAEQGSNCNFILILSRSKAYWPFQKALLLKPLFDVYDLDVRPTTDEVIFFASLSDHRRMPPPLSTRRLAPSTHPSLFASSRVLPSPEAKSSCNAHSQR